MSDSDEADCFGEQNPNGDTISSAEEHCSLSLDIIEDIKSQFFIEPSNTVEDPLEISLHTTAKGHFIEKSDSIRSPLDIKLRNMDRLLAINRQLVIYWNHWLVLETLKYLLRTSNTEDDLSLIVDRQDSDGDTAIFEICITVLRTRGNFDCYIFKCLKMCESPDEIPTTMFICVLRSCHQFDNHKPYVMAKNCANVGVMVRKY
ncbi:Hypothetical predicted protein [Mytilus galloprovincialis]|uniref:Uncharacterized protein n=1 Tax=Mytilus galloprovincialis TaxID=29158 RepID=A0A8B6HBD5_MYTGA|nr:Hypothetical predicted protein [Mytilus galloprovincialis]